MFVVVVVDRVGADITVLRQREVDYDSDVPHQIAEVLIRKVPDDQQVSGTFDKPCCFFGCCCCSFVLDLFFSPSLLILFVFTCSSWTCEWLSWVMWTLASPLCWVF